MKKNKKYIESIKNDEKSLTNLIEENKENKTTIINILNNIGRLPENFTGEWLFDFAKNNDPKVRLAAIKNIGKLKLGDDVKILYDLFDNEKNTENRREIISAI